MNFLSPASLFLFSLAVPIVALYILRLRRRREPISTLMFWEELFREQQTTSLFQRLKHLLSLLLQLLFLALLVFAIAQPQFAFITKSAQQLVVIIDQSASMNTIEKPDGLTRLEFAKQHAIRTVEGLRFMDEMTVISSHKRPVIHSPFTNHQKSLRAAIDRIQPTDISTNLAPAIDLAHAIAETKPNPKIIVFSDFQSIPETLLVKLNNEAQQDADPAKSDQGIEYRLIRVGKASENVGITQFRVRKSLANAFDYETLLSVTNTSEEEQQFNVELYFNENLFDVRPYTLAPGETKSEIFSNFSFEGGKLKAILDVNDVLPTDNIAYATLPKRELIPVLLVTDGNPFLEKAIAVDEKLKLRIVTPTVYESNMFLENRSRQDAPNYQVIIYDRYSPVTLGDGNYMFIYPPAAPLSSESANTELPWKIGEALQTPIITEWERDHPILRHVHLENVQIGEAYQVTPPPTAQILVRSFEDPVLFVDTTPHRKVVFTAINILESDLPLRIACPVIIANTIQWFQQGSRIAESHLQTGEILKQRIDPTAAIFQSASGAGTGLPHHESNNVKITGPGNKTWEISVKHGEVLFDQTQVAGFYELKLEDALPLETTSSVEDSPLAATPSTERKSGTLWAVNLADERESYVGTASVVEGLLAESVMSGSVTLLRYPPWVYFVCLAVALSVVEWFLYQRRRID